MRLSVIALLLSSTAILSQPVLAQENHHGSSEVQVQSQVVSAAGIVRDIDTVNKKITIDHDAIAELAWPAMRMRFTYTEDAPQYTGLKAGDKVSFTFIQQDTLSLLQSVSVR